jgi:hypothetical protein
MPNPYNGDGQIKFALLRVVVAGAAALHNLRLLAQEAQVLALLEQ